MRKWTLGFLAFTLASAIMASLMFSGIVTGPPASQPPPVEFDVNVKNTPLPVDVQNTPLPVEVTNPPVWTVKLATETFIVFDHEYVAEYSATETKTIDVDGYKTVHVLFHPGMENGVDIDMDVQWKFETPGAEYIESEMSTSTSGIHSFEVKCPTLCIRIVNNGPYDIPDNTVIVYAQG